MADRTRIDWCDATINPWGWGCYGPHGDALNPAPCFYCYAKRMAHRRVNRCRQCNDFVPHWHPEETWKPVHWRKPRRIFVASMSDPFGPWVEPWQMAQMLRNADACRQHTFYLLTKQPWRIWPMLQQLEARPSPNVWLGVSITAEEDAQRAEKYLGYLRDGPGWHVFASIEPMLAPVTGRWLLPYEWLIVGRMTGPAAKRWPVQKSWVLDIVQYGREHRVPVFVKGDLVATANVQEWP